MGTPRCGSMYFRAYGATMSRTRNAELGSIAVRLISLEDLAARAARLVLDLAAGQQVEQKHASDYQRMATLVDASQVEVAWRGQRRTTDPMTFREANLLLRDLIPARSSLLTPADYSQDTCATCPSRRSQIVTWPSQAGNPVIPLGQPYFRTARDPGTTKASACLGANCR